MNSRHARVALALLTLWVAGTARADAAEAKNRITGSATYRERVALTPDAVFEATLEEVSRVDAPSRVLARTRRTHLGQVPIAFEIAYDRRRIDSARRYVVRASIHVGGRLRFTSDRAYPVLTDGHGHSVAILLRAAKASSPGGPISQGGLENTRWVPVQIGDQVVSVAKGRREPWIELEPRSNRVTGSGGCNRLSGSYGAGRDSLRFGRIIATQMACISMETESAFIRALDRTRSYRVRGRVLELRDGRSHLLARLEERNLLK
jgi:putative lipoprotein